MFENLELVRTVVAAGGQERLAQELFVRRISSTARHLMGQRVRQAYDKFAPPGAPRFPARRTSGCARAGHTEKVEDVAGDPDIGGSRSGESLQCCMLQLHQFQGIPGGFDKLIGAV